MKQIIIFLLLIIVGIMGYNFYQKWQRFHPTHYEYVASEKIDANHTNKQLLLDYHEAIGKLNGHIITQWGANGIDVRNPEDDDKQTLAAVARYNELQGIVSFYESQLLAAPKKIEEVKPSDGIKKKELILTMFQANPSNNEFRLGQQSALIYEIQRILIEKGDSIRHDGLFRNETFNALKTFEEKNGLFADGKLDALTLDYLLR